jgi:hypothetical protein
MKQGMASSSRVGSTKVEPRPHSVNPAAVDQFGRVLGNHAMNGGRILPGASVPLYRGRGLKAPMVQRHEHRTMKRILPMLMLSSAAFAQSVGTGGLSGNFSANSIVPTQAMRTFDFIDAIGVNTHIDYTDGGYSNLGNIVTDLNYLGVWHIRDEITDGSGGSAPVSSYEAVAFYSIPKADFTFCLATGGAQTTSTLAYKFSLIDTLVASVSGSVLAVEGPNEINNEPITWNGGSGGISDGVAFQEAMYAEAKADTNLPGVQVDYFTGWHDVSSGAPGPNPIATPGVADYNNYHAYPDPYSPPQAWIVPANNLNNQSPGPYGPTVYTELGYDSSITNQDFQAKSILSMIMDAAMYGVHKFFLYELMDAYSGSTGWGLFSAWIGSSNIPKASGTAIHNLTAILSDTGGTSKTFTTVPVSYDLPSGLPLQGGTLAMQKSDGTYEIAVWIEPFLWNTNTDVEISNSAQSVPINFGQPWPTVNIYDPMSGTTPVSTYHDVRGIVLSLVDHPLIVELSRSWSCLERRLCLGK